MAGELVVERFSGELGSEGLPAGWKPLEFPKIDEAYRLHGDQ